MRTEWMALKRTISEIDHPDWTDIAGKCELAMIRDGMKPDSNTIVCGLELVDAIPWDQLSGMQKTRVRLLLRLGRIAEQLGQWSSASTCFQSAGTLAHTSGEYRLQAIALMEEGELLRRMGKLEQSVSCQEQAIDLARREGLLAEEADASNNLANALTELGEIDRAQDCFAGSLEIAERLNESRIEGHVYNNLGVIRCIQGTFREAIGDFSRAVTKREQSSDTRGIIETYHNMSMAFKDLGDLNRAEESIQIALEKGASISNEGLMTNLMLTSLEIKILKKDYEYAKYFARIIEARQKKIGDTPGLAETLKLKGTICLGMKDGIQADAFFQAALKMFAGMKLLHGEAETLELLAECKVLSGDHDAAGYYRTRAGQLYSRLGNHEKAARLLIQPE